jgi:hypothetical protein
MVTYTSLECDEQHPKIKDTGRWQPPRLSSNAAIEQAAAIADRFNRLVLRTLRQLRDLRRYTPAVTIQTAGQVNIGTQQVNMAHPQQQSI